MSSIDTKNYLNISVLGSCKCVDENNKGTCKCTSRLSKNDVITVSLCRNGALTHAFNSEQRMVTAKVTNINDIDSSIDVEMPVFHFEGYNSMNYHKTTFTPCPPGCYQLYVFVNGVPSNAKIIRMVRSTGFVPVPMPDDSM
jgi:hypothetical protein